MIVRTLVSILILTSAVFFFIFPKSELGRDLFEDFKTEVGNPKVLGLDNGPFSSESASLYPQISARSATIIDLASGKILYEKNPQMIHLPASTTKLMTALVALENCTMERKIQIGSVEKNGTQMKLEVGDVVTVENLIYGLLIASGNDAAYALAQNCAESYSEFIVSMNRKAQELGMENTHFVNPAGFDSEFQYSTALDLTKLARVAVGNPTIAKIVSIKSAVVTDVSGLKTYYLENVNKLLGTIDGLEGVKTGQTDGSGEILISKVTRSGHSIIIVVLGSDDRFGETQQLIDWAFENYRWN